MVVSTQNIFFFSPIDLPGRMIHFWRVFLRWVGSTTTLDNGSTPHPFIQKSRTEIRKPLPVAGSIPHPLDRTGPSTSADFTSNIAMENGPFEDVFPIKNGGFSMAMLVYQRVQGWFKPWPFHPPVGGRLPSWRSLNHPEKGTSRIARYSTNCWFGARWFGIRIRVPLRIPIPVIFGNPSRNQTTRPQTTNVALIDGYPLVN